jgi:hypothetical protein
MGANMAPIVLDQNVQTFLLAAPPSGTVFRKYTATNTSNGSQSPFRRSILSLPAYTIPPDARQPGTVKRLDTLDSRFVNASTQSGVNLWQTDTINLGGFPAPKFYRINTATNTVNQSGFYFASGTSDDSTRPSPQPPQAIVS